MKENICSPVLSLTITRNRNLDCTYCYFPNKGNITISKDVLEIVIRNYFSFFLKDVTESRILLSGGEPLLEKDLIFHVMEFSSSIAEKLGKSISFTLDTNGVLLSKDVVDKLKHYDVYVMTSIDGKKEVHDKQRPLAKTKTGSHEIIMSNVNYALNHLGNKNVAVRFTLLSDSVGKLFETFTYFHNNGFRIIDFAPNYEEYWSQDNIQMYGSEILKISEYIIENSIENKLIDNYLNFHLGISNTLSAYGHPCCIIPTVDTNGDFYACHRFIDNKDFLLGNYNNFSNIVASIRTLSKKYINYWQENGEKALASCPANNVCHNLPAFEVSDYFRTIINIMMEETEQALFNKMDCIYISKKIDYTIYSDKDEADEFMLVNNDNGDYILLNETGNILAAIIIEKSNISFATLYDTFIDFIEDNDNSIQIKKDILSFLKELQLEGILSLSIIPNNI